MKNNEIYKESLKDNIMLKVLPIYEEFGISKTKVFNHLLFNLIENEYLIDSQRDISLRLDVSLKTVSDTFIYLQDIGLLKQVKRGVYTLNKEFFE